MHAAALLLLSYSLVLILNLFYCFVSFINLDRSYAVFSLLLSYSMKYSICHYCHSLNKPIDFFPVKYLDVRIVLEGSDKSSFIVAVGGSCPWANRPTCACLCG